jgi:polyketide synthase 12
VLARAALDPAQPLPVGANPSLFHITMLLREACPDVTEIAGLALQVTAALEAPILLYVREAGPSAIPEHLAASWRTLVEGICRT